MKQQAPGRLVAFPPQALQAQEYGITEDVTDLFSPSALQRLQHSISKVDINHISGSLSFRHCTLPLEISRQGVSKQAWFFHLLLLIQEFFYSTFKRAHDASASSPTLSNAALRSSLPFIPHCAGQQTSFTAPKS